ncbi:MAG: hypothetical protein WCS20_15315 [Alphaproteobacteria bacterium]|jgi:hypothetical protein
MTDIESFLTQLARLTDRFPAVEGIVLWAEGDTWSAQDDMTERLDAEEIAFYAEGLLTEGFGMIWQAIAEPDSPRTAEHFLLMFWQGTCPPVPGDHGAEWVIQSQGIWPAGGSTRG